GPCDESGGWNQVAPMFHGGTAGGTVSRGGHSEPVRSRPPRLPFSAASLRPADFSRSEENYLLLQTPAAILSPILIKASIAAFNPGGTTVFSKRRILLAHGQQSQNGLLTALSALSC